MHRMRNNERVGGMKQVAVDTFTLDIYMAGDMPAAEAVCREYCDEIGLCVTLTPTLYIYTGGREQGFKVGLINYPRFPTTPDELWGKAAALADMLRERLAQDSYSIVSPNKTVWRSWREADRGDCMRDGNGNLRRGIDRA